MVEAPISLRRIPELLETHFQQLHHGSGISLEVIRERGYGSIIDGNKLRKLGFVNYQCRVPGILIPIWGVDGSTVGCQFKPDTPRVDRKGKRVKYETPKGASNRVDCPPRCQKLLVDPSTPLWITEGSKKADCLASLGECAVDIAGIWNWRGKNKYGGIIKYKYQEDYMTKLIDGTPVLKGEVIGIQVRVWCEFCNRYHYHGWPDPTARMTHRVTHCFKDSSPYHDSGYFVEVNDGVG